MPDLSSRAIIGTFFNQLEQSRKAWVDLVAMRFESDQASEEYKWLGAAPAMREFIGGRQAKGLRENGLTIANKKFEASLGISVDDLRRDKTGQILVRVRELADRAAMHDASLLARLILNGGTGKCYDGKAFFASNHAEGKSGTQSNDIGFDISDAGTGGIAAAPTARSMQGAILAGISNILGFMDDQGEPVNELASSFAVMASPSLMPSVLAAVSSQVIDGGVTNTIVNNSGEFKVKPFINPRLSSMTDSIVVFRTDGSVKPFIIQEEKKLEPIYLDENSEHAKLNGECLFSVDSIGNAGYGYWQHATRVTLAA